MEFHESMPCPGSAHPEGGTGRGQKGEEKRKPGARQDQGTAADARHSLEMSKPFLLTTLL